MLLSLRLPPGLLALRRRLACLYSSARQMHMAVWRWGLHVCTSNACRCAPILQHVLVSSPVHLTGLLSGRATRTALQEAQRQGSGASVTLFKHSIVVVDEQDRAWPVQVSP